MWGLNYWIIFMEVKCPLRVTMEKKKKIHQQFCPTVNPENGNDNWSEQRYPPVSQWHKCPHRNHPLSVWMKTPFCKEMCFFLIDGPTKEQQQQAKKQKKKKKEKIPMASKVIGHRVKPNIIMIKQMVIVINCILTCYLYIHWLVYPSTVIEGFFFL